MRLLPAAAATLVLAACAGTATRPAATPTPAGGDAAAAPTSAVPAIGSATARGPRTRHDGFLPVILDGGKILLELPRDSMRALMFTTLATGLGSNPVGLDRGANGGEYVVRFDRAGDRVLVVFENWSYRSTTGDADHRRSVAESFPSSTVASLPVVAGMAGRITVDATDFFVRDWLDVVRTLGGARQGTWTMARDRSAVYAPYTRAYPGNTEVDVALTFAATSVPGRTVEMIAPFGGAITLRQHVSLLPLPSDEYRPRPLDPRVGYFGIAFRDYAQPIQQPLVQRWASRHRLLRNADGTIAKAIVYYIDRGIPEPLRTATLEGARFWTQAFDRAGLTGAFRVELLPEGADPMDVRYNVVQWENRHERGWSIGGALTDPRTGELIKGMARMDSHRARTDYNLYAGLVGADSSAADTAFVLARIRQVTAHEIGHTLGLEHNYIASTYERGSVMDYPPPRVSVRRDGTLDLSQAYGLGPGDYDVWAIRWGYGLFPAASEADSLRAIVAEGLTQGWLHLSDADARPEFASDPRTVLWDDRATAVEFLRNQLAVRRVALDGFGERNIRPGQPLGLLQERFAPVYFMHRFAINAASRAIGGMEYANPLRGDGQVATRPVPAAEQRRALAVLVSALDPRELAIPDSLASLLVPGASAVTPGVELFGSRTAPVFDELGASRTLAQMVVDLVLQRERTARLASFAHRQADALTLGETIDALVAATWRPAAGEVAPAARKLAAIRRTAARAVADRLLLLAADTLAAPEVRGLVELRLETLRRTAESRAAAGGGAERDAERAHWGSIARDFRHWQVERTLPPLTMPLVAPPGDPF